LATIDMGRKLGAAVPFSMEGGAGSPSNTMWLGPRPISVPSGILIIEPFGHDKQYGPKSEAGGVAGSDILVIEIILVIVIVSFCLIILVIM